MGQKEYEIDENELLNMNSNFSEEVDSEVVTKTSFEYINVIGRGGYGKVWKVFHKKSKTIYALKEMSKVKIIYTKNEISVKNERTLLSKMFHPFIVNMHYSFQDSDNLYLVVDYLSGGDLRFQYCLDKQFNEEQTKFIICCIVLSLEYIHSNNILHRDIKPENLIFNENGYLKLTDFGIAKIYNKNIDNSKEHSGTLGYIAPEVLFHLKYDFRCDYYALGIVGYELMACKRPYDFRNRKEAREKILATEAVITKNLLKSGWSQNFMDFINKLIKRKPEERLGKDGIEEIKRHPWLKFFNWKDLYLMKIKPPYVPSSNDNFDSKYCNSEEFIPEEIQIKYENIMRSIRYKFIFEDYKYYNRKKDNLINKIINREMNISKNIGSIIKNKNGKKPIIMRNQDGNLSKITWKKYTMDNLNNMISEYKSVDFDNKKNSDNENENEEMNNYEEDIILYEMKTCINPHLVYRALEQKEIECLSNDEEEKNKNKKFKKYAFKSQSSYNKKNSNKKIIEGRNKNKLPTFKSNPDNLEMEKIKINKIINKKVNYRENKEKYINNIENIGKDTNNHKINIKISVNKNFKNDNFIRKNNDNIINKDILNNNKIKVNRNKNIKNNKKEN